MSKGFGESDFAQVQSDRLTTETVRRLRQQTLQQAEHAQVRRRLGGYGLCEDCGSGISAERLELLPEATRCVDCQTRLERDGHR